LAVDEVTEPVRARGLSVAVDDPLRSIITHGHVQHKNADHPYKRAALVLGDDEPLKLRAGVTVDFHPHMDFLDDRTFPTPHPAPPNVCSRS